MLRDQIENRAHRPAETLLDAHGRRQRRDIGVARALRHAGKGLHQRHAIGNAREHRHQLRAQRLRGMVGRNPQGALKGQRAFHAGRQLRNEPHKLPGKQLAPFRPCAQHVQRRSDANQPYAQHRTEQAACPHAEKCRERAHGAQAQRP